MDLIQAVILAVTEGVTEFLPISSTGHQVLIAQLIGLNESSFVKSFEIIIQLGAILAVVWLYWRRLWAGKHLWKQLFVAFLPAAVLGLVFYKIIKTVLLGNIDITIAMIGLGGVGLIILEKYYAKLPKKELTIDKLSYKQALIIGLWQCLSLVPGVSRSGSTIAGGLVLGMKRAEIVEFSFLLAIPTMFAATGYDLLKSHAGFTTNQYELLAVGMIGSFITAVLAIKWFIGLMQKQTLIPFGIYRIILAIVFWLLVIRTA